ncbi:MAG: hypothetical protein R3321_14705 [Nitrososphaeraceae archaeon]|nr:hypothetical protein [Nitrososphaeraceae archaeon]
MGRWDKDSNKWDEYGKERHSKRDYKKIAKYVIAGGFVVVAIVVLSVFIPRAGLTVEISEREAAHSVKTISVKINNNYPHELKDVTVQFGDNGKKYTFGNIGPFSAIFVTPDEGELNFDKVIVSANNGEFRTIKYR